MTSTPSIRRRGVGGDSILKGAVAAAAVAVVGLLLALGVELTVNSGQSITTYGLSFLWGTDWDPIHSIYGALPFIFGTIVTSALALLIALPISLGVAIFLSEKANKQTALRSVLGSLVELLAAVPSVIYGLWGLFFLSPFLRTYVEVPLHGSVGFIPLFSCAPFGLDYFVAGVILAIMIIPTVSAVSRDIMNAVPNSQREAMYSLGATDWEVIRRSVLPYAKSGIFGATILGLGRAVGETMAVTMVVGNSFSGISSCLFSQGYTLTSLIVNQFGETTSPLNAAAMVEIGLILFALALAINLTARLLLWRMTRGTRFRV